MRILTSADVENLTDFLEIIEARGEEDPDTLRELAGLRRRLENGESPLRSEAATLQDVARPFVDAREEEPGAEQDPGRADYTGLMERLAKITGE